MVCTCGCNTILNCSAKYFETTSLIICIENLYYGTHAWSKFNSKVMHHLLALSKYPFQVEDC